MSEKLYKWSGAGNLFMVADGRGKDMSELRQATEIQRICSENKTDGLMILDESADHDFRMEFYNPDGSGGMMCGNGGRCIAAFADYLGIRPAHENHFCFEAPDGLHSADLLQRPNGDESWIIRLKMIDVKEVTPILGGYFLNTGTRHFVKFVPDVEAVDVESEGKGLRWRSEFAPEGTNVNFVSIQPDGLHVRTFEKGVEGETDACGTGITASAIAGYYLATHPSPEMQKYTSAALELFSSAGLRKPIPVSAEIGPSYRHLQAQDGVKVALKARRDWLKVEFQPDLTEVYLTGPAELLA